MGKTPVLLMVLVFLHWGISCTSPLAERHKSESGTRSAQDEDDGNGQDSDGDDNTGDDDDAVGDDDDATGDDDDATGDDDDASGDDDDSTNNTGMVFAAKAFTSATAVYVGENGVCPNEHLIFALDDSTTPSGYCGPAPAAGMLSGPVTETDTECPENQVLVGFGASPVLKCRQLAAGLTLEDSEEACYHGGGVAGAGTKVCENAPPGFTNATLVQTGTDRCLGDPPGESIMVGWAGASCSQMTCARILHPDGSAVQLQP